MDLELSNRVVPSQGPAAAFVAIAATMLAEGARVLLTRRDGAALEDARASLATGMVLGLQRMWLTTATAGIVSALDAWKPPSTFEVLVANVGGGYLAGWDVGDDKLEAALEHNLAGSVRLVREAWRMQPAAEAEGTGAEHHRHFLYRGRGHHGCPFAYGMAKAGLNHFVGEMALVGPSMRVNAVAPGYSLRRWQLGAQSSAAWGIERWIRREVALKRFGTVEEIADVVTFLASPRAAFVTGATWIADGGQVRAAAEAFGGFTRRWASRKRRATSDAIVA